MNDQGADTSAGPGDAGAQWQMRVVDTVDDVVTALHERVIRPLLLAARAIVFGIIAAAMALVVSILLSIAAVRLLDVYAFRGRAWASDVVIGGLLAVAGAVLWTRRRARGGAETS
jgi:hypothetical protein